ncbi:MAG: YchJ family protein [Nitrospirota bacterium]
MDLCPCGSTKAYADCCRPVITGERRAETAEQLMRSRYSAYVVKELAWLKTSLHPDHRGDYDEASSKAWADRAEWHGIEILGTEKGGPGDQEGTVEFSVSFTESGVRQEYRERSSFAKAGETWYFTSGKVLPPRPVQTGPKTGRNDPCPCGSGKKFKKCCG